MNGGFVLRSKKLFTAEFVEEIRGERKENQAEG
jgi:hypothetical protein